MSAGLKHYVGFSTRLYSIAREVCNEHTRRAGSEDHTVNSSDTDGQNTITRPRSVDSQASDDATDTSAVRVDDHSAPHTGRVVNFSKAVDDLPKDQREVFLLRQVVDMPWREISIVTGESEEAVKSRMRDALEALRSAIQPSEKDAER